MFQHIIKLKLVQFGDLLITNFKRKNKSMNTENISSENENGNNANTVLCAVIESTTGYSCPNCGAICSDKTLISRTEAEFEELPDPHYSWEETHKCQKCETLYLLHNGT